MEAVIHTLHVILAGTWLGGVVFTTLVLSPALKAMKWSETYRVGVRSAIGKRYARVGTANLILVLVFAALGGIFVGFTAWLCADYALLVLLFGLVTVHGAYFGRRLKELAEAERKAGGGEEARSLAIRRRSLQRASLRISMLDLGVSVVVVALAVGARQ